MERTRFVALVDKDLPTDHSFLDGVIAGLLPTQGVAVTFVGFGPSGIKERSEVEYIYIRPRYRSFFLRKMHKLVAFTSYLWTERNFHVLFTRNDPVYLIIAWILKFRNSQLVHVHQISHLHAYSTSIRTFAFRIKSFFDILLRRFFFKDVDRFFLVSDEMRRFMEKKWPDYSGRFRVVPLGIRTDEFADIIPWSERKFDLVYVGTLARSRRIEVLIDAVKDYNSTGRSLVLNIWGSSHNHDDEEYLKSYAVQAGQSDYIKFNGRVSRAEITEILKDSRIGLSVIPSDGLLKQISPTKLMEYMAAGCVVIASRGIVDQEHLMRNAGGGYLIDFDAKALANCIQRIFEEEDDAASGALRARQFIFAERSYERITAEIVEDMKG